MIPEVYFDQISYSTLGNSIALIARNGGYRRHNSGGKTTTTEQVCLKRKVLAPHVFRLVKILIADVQVLLTHHGRTASLEAACSSCTTRSSPAAGTKALSLRKSGGTVSGYEAGGSMVLPSQMEELSELTDGLTPLQGLQTKVMVCKTPHLKLSTFTVSVLLAITDLTFAPQTY